MERISAVTGVTPTLIRCPYGEYDDHVIAAIRAMGMEPIQWDVDSLDWKDYDADTICKRVTSKVQPGSIVLFHNAALHTPEALPAILTCLINDGYTVVPISQLILPQPYTIDHTGRQFLRKNCLKNAKMHLFFNKRKCGGIRPALKKGRTDTHCPCSGCRSCPV